MTSAGRSEPAVAVEDLASDPASGVGHEESHEVGGVSGCSDPAGRGLSQGHLANVAGHPAAVCVWEIVGVPTLGLSGGRA